MKSIIKIKELRLLNFKGAADVTVRFNDGRTVISGANGTGKSTVFDAFTWLLFDRDSRGRADFSVKTLDAEGNVIPRIEHSVEGLLDVDGREMRLRKVLREKWVKRRGTSDEDFVGNEVARYIDDVPVAMKAWNDRIAEICSVETFPLLTNLMWFTALKTDEQRKLLSGLVGDIFFEDVNSDGRLTRIAEKKPDNVSARDFLKSLRGKRDRLSAELDRMAAMIDERRRDIDEDCNLDAAQRALAAAKSRMEEAQKLVDVEDERRALEIKEATSARKRIAKLQMDIQEIEEKLRGEALAAWYARREIREKLEKQRGDCLAKATRLDAEVERVNADIAVMTKTIEVLREKYSAIYHRDFDDSSMVCPACGRPYDSYKVDEIQRNFNIRKAAELKANCEEGMALKVKIDEALNKASRLRDDAQIERLQAEKITERPEYQEEPMPEWTYVEGSNETIEMFRREEKELTDRLAQGIKMSDTDCAAHLELMRNEVSGCEAVVKRCEKSAEAKARVAELERERVAAADELAAVERDEDDLNEWVRRINAVIESRINGKFGVVRFKLFEPQVNGGVADICTATVGGVPFNSLNTAARITAGMEIVAAFQQHHEVSLPVFVDNAEAVNVLPTMDCQVVELRVTNDAQMIVE